MNIHIYSGVFLNCSGAVGYAPFPTITELKVGQIHIWKACLNLPENLVFFLKDFLSDEERRKADRFRFLHHQKQYIVFHGTFRKLLGGYLGVKEKDMVFESRPHGKPRIQKIFNPEDIRFSMSRSSEIGVYAFTLKNEVGVDIEKMRPLPEIDSIVNEYFSDNEKHIYKEVKEKQKEEWFYTVWTRKEALIKAIGLGLYFPLKDADVSNTGMVKIKSDTHRKDLTQSNLIVDDVIYYCTSLLITLI